MLEARLKTVQWLSPAGLQNLAYREWGDAHNPHVLICVHGLTRVGQDFETLAQVLGQRVRVIAPDVPGRGKSDWLPNPALYSVPNYAAAMVALIARTDAQTIDWLGTSMGGLIGMGVTSMKGHPIRRFIINDVGPELKLEALQRIGTYVGHPVFFNNMEEATGYIKSISVPFGPHTDAQWRQLTEYVAVEKEGKIGLHYDPSIAEPFKSITAEQAQFNEAMLWGAYDAIQADTLLIRGEHSDLLSVETATQMTQRGPKAKLVELKGIGHAPTFMQPDQIALVERFIMEGSI
ncbi:MAG: alpha/beta hydrolase [Burkholderiales bacterium]|nr:alpha/beta hydrolase [Burkholderiales bacterium]